MLLRILLGLLLALYSYLGFCEYHSIVLGSGLVGLGVANKLAESGESVLVLEKTEIPHDLTGSRFNNGLAASYQNAGMLNFLRPTPTIGNYWARLTLESFERLGVPISYGGVSVVTDSFVESQAISFIGGIAVRSSHWPLFSLYERNLAYSNLRGLFHSEIGAAADPEKTMEVLLKKSRSLGVNFVFGSSIQAIKKQQDGTWKVHTNTGVFAATHIVVAAGPSSKEIMRDHFALHTPLTRVLGIMIEAEQPVSINEKPWFTGLILGGKAAFRWGLAEALSKFTGQFPLEVTLELGKEKSWSTHLYVQNRGSKICVGGPRIVLRDDYSQADLLPMKYKKYIDETLEYAHKVLNFPKGISFDLEHSAWAGIMAFSNDGNAYVGPVKGLKGIYLATGFASTGFMRGYGAGQWLGQVILDDGKIRNLADPDMHDYKTILPGNRLTKWMPAAKL